MKKLLLIAGIAGAIVLAACAHSSAPQEICVGVITKIEEPPGDYYSPAKGHQPLTRVSVRLRHIGNESSSDLITILFFELYRPAQFGREGDTVRFICPEGPLQASEAWFADLKGYSVDSQKLSRLRDK